MANAGKQIKINSNAFFIGITYLKPKENQSLEGIVDRKACKKACRKNFSSSIAFVHQLFQNLIYQVTNEDLRIRIYQNPKEGYGYSVDREKDEHYCKCVDKGYQIKVSPRLLDIINSKFNDTQGELKIEIMNEYK